MRVRLTRLAAIGSMVGAVLGVTLPVTPLEAALLLGTHEADLLIGPDDDNNANAVIQPPAVTANQSLNNTDIVDGSDGDDVLIGLLGSDVLLGGKGHDVIVGGTEQATPPNSDVMIGDDGDDVALWRGGDGSEAFLGGKGRDALVFGNIDRDASNVPLINPVKGRYHKTGLPSADVTGQGGFCTLEDVRGSGLGYDFLVRFFVRSTGALAVTLRTSEVEQVFCTSETGGAITFADLTDANPAFAEVGRDRVRKLNKTVDQIIR